MKKAVWIATALSLVGCQNFKARTTNQSDDLASVSSPTLWKNISESYTTYKVGDLTEVRFSKPRLHNFRIAFENLEESILERNFSKPWNTDGVYLGHEMVKSKFGPSIPLSARQFCNYVGFLDAVYAPTEKIPRDRLDHKNPGDVQEWVTFYKSSTARKPLWALDSTPTYSYKEIACRGMTAKMPRHDIKIYHGGSKRFDFPLDKPLSLPNLEDNFILLGVTAQALTLTNQNNRFPRTYLESGTVNFVTNSTSMGAMKVRKAADRFCKEHHHIDGSIEAGDRAVALGYTLKPIRNNCELHRGPTFKDCTGVAFRAEEETAGHEMLPMSEEAWPALLGTAPRATRVYDTITCATRVDNGPEVEKLALSETNNGPVAADVYGLETGLNDVLAGSQVVMDFSQTDLTLEGITPESFSMTVAGVPVYLSTVSSSKVEFVAPTDVVGGSEVILFYSGREIAKGAVNILAPATE